MSQRRDPKRTDHVRPEADEINYITPVKVPTLMLNDRYDTIFPFEATVKPIVDLLGTPAEHKRLRLYETDHFVPRNELIKETLASLAETGKAFFVSNFWGPLHPCSYSHCN